MTLSELARKYGTDKCPTVSYGGGSVGHSYTEFYEELFAGRNVRRLLEVGIYRGASLRMWEEYFPKAEIFGIDNNPFCLIDRGRIHSFLCDAGDRRALGYCCQMRMGGDFDIAIDDGSHDPCHQIIFAQVVVPLLNPGGVCVIEDVDDACAHQVMDGIGISNRAMITFGRVSTNDRIIIIEKGTSEDPRAD